MKKGRKRTKNEPKPFETSGKAMRIQPEAEEAEASSLLNACLGLCVGLVVGGMWVLCCWFLLAGLAQYWRMESPPSLIQRSGALCQPPCGSPEARCRFPESYVRDYLRAHAEFRRRAQEDCEGLLQNPPDVLVHRCRFANDHDWYEVNPELGTGVYFSCGGFGDRVIKMAGLFEIALLTNRTFFVDWAEPDLHDYYRPTEEFQWAYDGDVRECLERGALKRPHLYSYPYFRKGAWGRRGTVQHLRHIFWPYPEGTARTLFATPIVYTDGDANTLRPLEISNELRFDVEASWASLSGKLPRPPVMQDDSRLSLWAGCFASQFLNNPTLELRELVLPLLQRADEADLLVALHMRFGDQFMFKFEGTNSTVEGIDTDRHFEPTAAIVRDQLRCVLRLARKALHEARLIGSRKVAVFVLTDMQQAEPWFALEAESMRREGELGLLEFDVFVADVGPPANALSFGLLNEAQQRLGERRLFVDFEMMRRADLVLTSGSQLSFMGASAGLNIPYNTKHCGID